MWKQNYIKNLVLINLGDAAFCVLCLVHVFRRMITSHIFFRLSF